jgi:exonuclease SbcD
VGQGNKAAAVYQIPFLHPGEIRKKEHTPVPDVSSADKGGQQNLFAQQESFQNRQILRTQQELVSEAAAQILEQHNAITPLLPSIVCAHLFTGAGHVSDSERSCIGTAEQVDADIFSPFSYTALGHLHGVQNPGKKSNIWYSGSPLAYSFDDSPETFMLSVCIEKKAGKEIIEVNKIRFNPLHAVIRLNGPFKKFYGNDSDKQLVSQNAENYVEIVCTDNHIPDNPMALLRQNFHNILSFRRQDITAGTSDTVMENRRRVMESDSADKPEKIFDLFMQDVYGGNIPSEETFQDERKLFLKLAEKYSWTEDQE